MAKKKIIKKIDSLTEDWSIVIAKDEIEEAIKEELVKIQSRVHLDGFRKGNAPIDVIKKQYGDDAFYRAVNNCIRKNINEIIDEEKLALAMRPEVSMKDELEQGKDISAVVRFILKPEMPKNMELKKISVDVVELELTEEDKKEELERFREKMAKRELDETGKNVEKGDLVDIDFVGSREGENFGGGTAYHYKLEIGSNTFVEGFEEQIIGHKKGDIFDLNVKFPENYHSSDLADKDATFKITLHDIFVSKKPELNDEFAKSIGFEDMEKLKDLLFQNLKNVYEAQMKDLIKGSVFEAVIKGNKFDLPKSVIEQEAEEKLNKEKEEYEKRAEENKNNKDFKEKFDEKELLKKITEDLTKSYSAFYLTEHIAEQNNISVNEDEVKQTITQEAIRTGANVEEMLKNIDKDDKLKNYIAFSIKEAKVFNYIYDNISKNITNKDRKAFEQYLTEQRKKKFGY